MLAGQLVVYATPSPCSELPPGVGAVVKVHAGRALVEGQQWESIVASQPRAPPHARWVDANQLVVFEPTPSSFPLASLPLSVLSVVMRQLPFAEAAQWQCRVSKRFLAAFRDDVAWRARCVAEMPPGTDVDALFRTASDHNTYYTFYLSRCRWLVTLPCQVTPQELVLLRARIPPTTLVSDMFHVWLPLEQQAGLRNTRYFDALRVGAAEFTDSSPCTIAEAGLFDGARLRQDGFRALRLELPEEESAARVGQRRPRPDNEEEEQWSVEASDPSEE